ncbi:hypothetical protein [Cypionkella sp.]|uniref:hypothetical protein n=1 Tax=Cypionkella sp. TaxID=2811411 RepID=UPI0037539ECA
MAIADVVDTKVQDLYKQGYTYFEFARGTVKSQIEAYAPNGTKMIFLDNQSGISVAEQLFQGSVSDFTTAASNIAEIYYEQADSLTENSRADQGFSESRTANNLEAIDDNIAKSTATTAHFENSGGEVEIGHIDTASVDTAGLSNLRSSNYGVGHAANHENSNTSLSELGENIDGAARHIETSTSNNMSAMIQVKATAATTIATMLTDIDWPLSDKF